MSIFGKKEKTPVKLKDLFLQCDKEKFVEYMHKPEIANDLEYLVKELICSDDDSRCPVGDKKYLSCIFDELVALAEKEFDETLTQGYVIRDACFFDLDFFLVTKEERFKLQDVTQDFYDGPDGQEAKYSLHFLLNCELDRKLLKSDLFEIVSCAVAQVIFIKEQNKKEKKKVKIENAGSPAI